MAEKIFLLFVVVFSGLGTQFYRSQTGIFILFLLTLLLVIKNNMTISKQFYRIMAIWAVYTIALTITYRAIHPYFAILMPIKIFAAYFLINYFKESLFERIEKIIYVFCLISLFFFTWQVISLNSLHAITNNINISGNMGNPGYVNFLLFTINHKSFIGEIRNCGFTWEPGPFSCMLALATFFNLARTNFNIARNVRFWVFLVALASTQSTTGYLAIFVILIWIAINNPTYRRNIVISIIIFTVIIIFLFLNIPFLQDKILNEYTQKDELETLIATSRQQKAHYAPGRFISFMIDFRDFINNPVLGYGGHPQARWMYNTGAHVSPIGGIGNIMAKYGLFGIFFYILILVRSSQFLARYYKYKGAFIWSLVILIITFGFGIIETPIFLAVLLFPFLRITETEDTIPRNDYSFHSG